MQQRVLYNLRQPVVPKETFAIAAIEKIMNPRPLFNLSLLFRKRFQFLAPFIQYVLRQRIEEVKTNVLCQTFAIEMREVASRIPPITRLFFRHDQSFFEKLRHRYFLWRRLGTRRFQRAVSAKDGLIGIKCPRNRVAYCL